MFLLSMKLQNKCTGCPDHAEGLDYLLIPAKKQIYPVGKKRRIHELDANRERSYKALVLNDNSEKNYSETDEKKDIVDFYRKEV